MTFAKQISLLALLAFLGLALSGCQPSDPDSPNVKQLTSIAVTPNPVNMVVGGFAALTVTGTLEDNSTYVVNFGTTFASSAPSVATVAADTGYVTAVAAGDAIITATHTASGLTATTIVTVSPGGGGGGGAFEDITFESAGVPYEFRGFGGAEDSTLQLDPTDATNTVARVNRSADAAVFAGTVVSTGPNETVGKIPFSATNTRMTVRVYSPAAGITVRLKVEDSSADDPPNPNTRTVETDAVTTMANAWETLTFDFANPVAGTPALDLSYNYDRLVIFFNFGVDGAAAGAQTFYFDDMTFVIGGASGNTGTCTGACIDFASPSVKYEPFEGLVSAAQSNDPVDASNKVAEFVKGPSGQPWAGATVYTIDATKSVPEFDLSGSKIVTLRVYSPMAGMNVRMKLEDAGNSAIYLEKDVLTTKANEWETLSFDFATPVNGVYDPANTYDRVSLFPAFSTTAPPASNVTVYFDELDYTTTGGGGGGGGSGSTGTCSAPNCTDFSSGGIGFGVFENPGGGTAEVAADPNDASNDVVKFVKTTGDNDYFGTTITGLAGPAELTATNKTVTLRVYSPTVGTNFLFKLEGGPGGAVVEKDMVTTVAGDWETLSFDLSAGATGTYATVVIFPNGRSKVTTDKTMYIDELKFPASGGGGGGSGSTGTCTDAACIDFSEPGIGFGPFENGGGGTVAIVDDPNDAANKVVQFVKKPGDGDYFGTTITGLGGSVVLTPTAKTVTMRVYSPTVGTNFLLKFEGGTGGPATTEKDVATTVAGAWETLSFVMPDAGTYSVVVLFPNGRSSVAADKTMYVDELRFPEFSTGGGGSGCGTGGEPADMGSGGPQTLVLSGGDSKGIFAPGEGIFAIDYKGSLESNGNCGGFFEAHTDGTPGGGNIGYFNDTLMSTSGQKIDEGGWIVGTSLDPGGIPNFFRYFVLTAPAATFSGSYMGLYANAPNDGTLNVQAFSKIKFRVWGPAEMYQQANFNPVLEVVLSGPKVANCVATDSGGTEITQSFTANQKIGAGSAYTLPLSGFTVKGLCGSDTAGTAVASVLSNLSRVTVTVPPTSFNFTNANPGSPVTYSTGVNLGPIGFTNN